MRVLGLFLALVFVRLGRDVGTSLVLAGLSLVRSRAGDRSCFHAAPGRNRGEGLIDIGPRGRLGRLGDAERVRAHVGDEPRLAELADGHAFVELLGDEHRLLYREAQHPEAVLLEGARDVGRPGVLELGLDLDLVQDERRPLTFLADDLGFFFVMDLGLLAVDLGQRCLEGRRVLGLELGRERPVLLGDEGLDLLLPVDDQAQGDGLDPAGRQPPGDLLPQERADEIAGEPVEDAPRLLGVEQVEIDLAEALEGRLDALLGDLIEGHPEDVRVRVRQELAEMPGDGLAFPVGVGGENDPLALLGRLLELGDRLLLLGDDFVGRLEVGGDVDPHLLFRQVADVAHRGLDDIVLAEIVVDRLGLGRRFDDHE